MIDRQVALYEQPPRQAAFDGAFASKSNLAVIKNKGVEDVAFAKGRGLQVKDMVKSSWAYQRLRRFRSGIEGVISFLKRVFGLDRCTWRSFASFKSYVWSSIIAANLLVMARHIMKWTPLSTFDVLWIRKGFTSYRYEISIVFLFIKMNSRKSNAYIICILIKNH